MDTLKGMWKSWTVWFNGVAVALITALPMLQDALPQLAPYMSAEVYKSATLAIVLVNLALRFKTSASLASKV